MAIAYGYRRPARRSKWRAWSIGLVLVAALGSGTIQAASSAGTPRAQRASQEPTSPASVPAEHCERMTRSEVAEDVTLVRADLVPRRGEILEHCHVVGFVTTQGDRHLSSNRVGFHVGLPTEWNGDFHFQGVGGFAGVLGDLSAGLSRGYASASTDTGHVGSAESGDPTRDGSWALGNRAAQIDWGYRGTHVATVAAKEVTRIYYQQAARRSFFVGCSNGGRQGLMEAQRYPADYDGIVAHSPAVSTVDMFLAWIWQVQAQLNGPRAWLSPRDLALVSRLSLDTAAEAGQVIDGLVVNPEGIRPDLAAMRRSGELSGAKIRTLRRIYEGWRRGGTTLVRGHPIGHEEGWETFLTGSTPPVGERPRCLGRSLTDQRVPALFRPGGSASERRRLLRSPPHRSAPGLPRDA